MQVSLVSASKITSDEERAHSYSQNFASENPTRSSKLDEEETFDHRPLLDLISELNRRHTQNQSSTSLSADKGQSLEQRRLSLSPTDILPPKPLSPFRPVIVHRKYQVKWTICLLSIFSYCSTLGADWPF